ncbi:hypothetical protein QE364_003959 [Nocardioides zeae]|uniref:Uncharacterized protein n=1 Tax=Nocardioides zeae TaxID=1457234 RepID=A0ACC6IN90_9ACTN|nr:hypothetical protein [Nocardioides zeae]MDR6212225.1 hypothetical protein [Nocardioides zeae]
MRRTSMWAAGTAAVVALTVGAPMTNASAPPAEGSSFTFSDAARDARINVYYSRGPAFTHRIDQQASDIRSVGVVTTESVVYVRVNVRDLYGQVRASNRQEGEQTIAVILQGPENSPRAGGYIRWTVGRPVEQGTNTYAGSLDDIHTTPCTDTPRPTASGSGNYVLFRIPTRCVVRGADEAVFDTVHAITQNTVRQLDAGGRELAQRLYVDDAVSSGA